MVKSRRGAGTLILEHFRDGVRRRGWTLSMRYRRGIGRGRNGTGDDWMIEVVVIP